MFGVVLWSDSERKSAVIWCEDQLNLAFVREVPDGAEPGRGFSPGDLVAFDLREENDIRLAVDPCIVTPQEYPWLATHLKAAAERRDLIAPQPDSDDAEQRVVVLHPGAPCCDAGTVKAPCKVNCG